MSSDDQGPIDGEAPLAVRLRLDALAQRAPVEQLHRGEGELSVALHVEHADQIRVVELAPGPDADGDDVFRLVDEAYRLIQSKSPQVKTTPANDGKTEYLIDMKRKIGYLGGQTGNRKNHPSLYKVKLILAEDRVITAYPY